MNIKLTSLEGMNEHIDKLMDILEEKTVGSPEYETVMEELTKLWELRNKTLELLYKVESTEQKDSNDKNERYFKYGMPLITTLLQIGASSMWLHKGFKFEETGAVSSFFLKNIVNRQKLL